MRHRIDLARVAVLLVVATSATLVTVGLALGQGLGLAGELLVVPVFQSFTAVGAVLTLRRRGNVIGWLFLLTGLASALQGFSEQLVTRAQEQHQIQGLLVHAAAWLQSWLWLPTLAVPLVFGTLLFPDGRSISRRWRLVAQLGIVGIVAVVVPLGGVGWTVPTSELLKDQPAITGWKVVVFGAAYVGILLCLLCALLGVASLFVRYRRGDEVTRQQLKLVLFAAALAVVLNVSGSVFPDFQNTLEPMGTALIALAVGAAVLRYRLYDIDRIVSRTVSYALVTGLLVAFYLGCVAAVNSIAGASSQLGVAASTLLAAAAFQPLRKRVQVVVDRRFNRARYDATRTVEAFAVRLRDEVHVEVVHGDLLGVVHRTLEPSSASLWMAGGAA